VSANGGQIQVRNVAGHGCIFTVELPRWALETAGTDRAEEVAHAHA